MRLSERLSHQHHQGLFAALQVKRARQHSAAEARSAFLHPFEREGRDTSGLTKSLLRPAYARHAELDKPAIVRVLTEQVDLRRRGQDLEASADLDPAELRELPETLLVSLGGCPRVRPYVRTAPTVGVVGSSLTRPHFCGESVMSLRMGLCAGPVGR